MHDVKNIEYIKLINFFEYMLDKVFISIFEHIIKTKSLMTMNISKYISREIKDDYNWVMETNKKKLYGCVTFEEICDLLNYDSNNIRKSFKYLEKLNLKQVKEKYNIYKNKQLNYVISLKNYPDIII